MHARFFRSDAMAERLGETPELVVTAESFQVTYNALRTVPDGETVATFDYVRDTWHAAGREFSDFTIYAREEQ